MSLPLCGNTNRAPLAARRATRSAGCSDTVSSSSKEPVISATVPPSRRRSLRYFAYLVLMVVNIINLLSYAHDDALRY
ncbi:hypothetical protein ACFQ1S_36305, partial [Kibdelosporangium lantanae]